MKKVILKVNVIATQDGCKWTTPNGREIAKISYHKDMGSWFIYSEICGLHYIEKRSNAVGIVQTDIDIFFGKYGISVEYINN